MLRPDRVQGRHGRALRPRPQPARLAVPLRARHRPGDLVPRGRIVATTSRCSTRIRKPAPDPVRGRPGALGPLGRQDVPDLRPRETRRPARVADHARSRSRNCRSTRRRSQSTACRAASPAERSRSLSPVTSAMRAEHLGAVAERPGRTSTVAAWPAAGSDPDRPSDLARSPSSSSCARVREIAAEHDRPPGRAGRRGRRGRVRSHAPCLAHERRRVTVAGGDEPEQILERRPAAARRAMQVDERPGADATVSRQPRLPQRQTAPCAPPARTCPISPAAPIEPRYRRPPSTSPAPIPGRQP